MVGEARDLEGQGEVWALALGTKFQEGAGWGALGIGRKVRVLLQSGTFSNECPNSFPSRTSTYSCSHPDLFTGFNASFMPSSQNPGYPTATQHCTEEAPQGVDTDSPWPGQRSPGLGAVGILDCGLRVSS